MTEEKGNIAAKITTTRKDKEERAKSGELKPKTIHRFGLARPLAAESRPAVRRTGITSTRRWDTTRAGLLVPRLTRLSIRIWGPV